MQKVMLWPISALLIHCAHGPNRIGYSMNKRSAGSCDIPMVLEFDARYDQYGRTLGRLQMGDNGLSVLCSEEHALKVAREDACALGADVIVLNNEQRPYAGSTCYRAEYEFYAMDSTHWKGGQWLFPEVGRFEE
jgi:hypothetical protein